MLGYLKIFKRFQKLSKLSVKLNQKYMCIPEHSHTVLLHCTHYVAMEIETCNIFNIFKVNLMMFTLSR